jgi:hypothetical protein
MGGWMGGISWMGRWLMLMFDAVLCAVVMMMTAVMVIDEG